MDISKSIIDVKSAVDRASRLTTDLYAVAQLVEAKLPITDEAVGQIKQLGEVKDCKALLVSSPDLDEQGANARDKLVEAWDKFAPLIPESASAFLEFKNFMDAQWQLNADGTDSSKGEVSFLLSVQEPSRLFPEFAGACFAGTARLI